MPRRPNNATDAIIVATTKVHRQQAITSSFDDDTRIPKSARILVANNATDAIIVATVKVHRQQAIASSFDDDTRIHKSTRVAFKLNASETVTGTSNF
jgi:anionic cell wall polymer biosynthesis LytR-Cps2A-Psr (LCP) family protein